MEPKRQKLDLEIVDETNCDAWNFNDFPNEIIEKIFSYLTQNQLGQIARVCKKWNALKKSPVLWRSVNVEIFCSSDGEEEDESFKSLIDGLPSCVTFIRLDFSGQAYLNFEELCMQLNHSCPDVETLILECCHISTILPEVINVCTQFLPGLKKLVFRYCHFKDNSGFAELKDNSNIEVLDLYWSFLHHSSKIQFSKLHSLKELRLASTSIDVACFVSDTSFLNHLQVLDLRGTCVTASTFRAIERYGQNLRELYLCRSNLDDNDLQFNGPVFPHLQTICLSGTYVICEGLVSLARSCPSLVSVYIDENVAVDFAKHPFAVANRCKSEIVKGIDWGHDHNVDYSPK